MQEYLEVSTWLITTTGENEACQPSVSSIPTYRSILLLRPSQTGSTLLLRAFSGRPKLFFPHFLHPLIRDYLWYSPKVVFPKGGLNTGI